MTSSEFFPLCPKAKIDVGASDKKKVGLLRTSFIFLSGMEMKPNQLAGYRARAGIGGRYGQTVLYGFPVMFSLSRKKRDGDEVLNRFKPSVFFS